MSTTSTLNPARSGAGSKILPNFRRLSPFVHIQPSAIPSRHAASRSRYVSPAGGNSRLSRSSSAPSRGAPAIAEVTCCTSVRNRSCCIGSPLQRQLAPIRRYRRGQIASQHHFAAPLDLPRSGRARRTNGGLVIAVPRSRMRTAMGGEALIQYRFDSVEQLARHLHQFGDASLLFVRDEHDQLRAGRILVELQLRLPRATT